MGRGVGWTDAEIGHLARSWFFASEDAIAGIDQTAARFKQTMFDKFKSFAPATGSEKGYGSRTPKSVASKFDEVPADVQKFRASLSFIRAAHPTGVTED